MPDSHLKHERVPFVERLKSGLGIFGLHWGSEPHYQVVYSEGEMELRRYDAVCIAQTPLNEESFAKLTDYIFGRNSRDDLLPMSWPIFRDLESAAISPETVHRPHRSAPTMSFLLPHELRRDECAEPTERDVRIVKLAPLVVASLKFSGVPDEEAIVLHGKKLLHWMEGLHVIADHMRLAEYDSPHTIPFLRKNEVQIVIKSVH